MPERRPIPFRWIFSLGQLALCWFSIALATVLPLRIYRHYILRTIYSLNVLGGLLQLPITLLRGSNTDWYPPGVDSLLWRAVTWPLLALVFWWIAGRAVEALVALPYRQLRPRITLVEVVAAFLIMSGGIFLIGGSLIMERGNIYTKFDSALLPIAGGLWAFLGGLTVVAGFRQWRLRRRSGQDARLKALLNGLTASNQNGPH